MGVEDYFRAGIQASMDYYMIDPNFTTSYINGLKIYSEGNNPFSGGDKEAMLEQIITQKWLAVFPNGNEGWAEFRRTDYPALLNQLTNESGGDVPQGKTIKRLLYPNSEASNQYFVENADLKAKNTQGTRLWWDIADTKDSNGNRLKPNNFHSAITNKLLQ